MAGPRHELGDQLTDLTFNPSAPSTIAGVVPAPKKVDHKAKFTGFDTATGAAAFDISACDPTTEEPLIGLTVVYVPVGHGLPVDAIGFLGLPDSDYPKASLDLTPAEFGKSVSLPRPAAMKPGVKYLGQAIHTYAQ